MSRPWKSVNQISTRVKSIRLHGQPSQSDSEASDDGSSYSAGLATIAVHHNIHSEDDMFQFLAQSAIENLAIPNTHGQAMNCVEAKFWKEAEQREKHFWNM